MAGNTLRSPELPSRYQVVTILQGEEHDPQHADIIAGMLELYNQEMVIPAGGSAYTSEQFIQADGFPGPLFALVDTSSNRKVVAMGSLSLTNQIQPGEDIFWLSRGIVHPDYRRQHLYHEITVTGLNYMHKLAQNDETSPRCIGTSTLNVFQVATLSAATAQLPYSPIEGTAHILNTTPFIRFIVQGNQLRIMLGRPVGLTKTSQTFTLHSLEPGVISTLNQTRQAVAASRNWQSEQVLVEGTSPGLMVGVPLIYVAAIKSTDHGLFLTSEQQQNLRALVAELDPQLQAGESYQSRTAFTTIAQVHQALRIIGITNPEALWTFNHYQHAQELVKE